MTQNEFLKIFSNDDINQEEIDPGFRVWLLNVYCNAGSSIVSTENKPISLRHNDFNFSLYDDGDAPMGNSRCLTRYNLYLSYNGYSFDVVGETIAEASNRLWLKMNDKVSEIELEMDDLNGIISKLQKSRRILTDGILLYLG